MGESRLFKIMHYLLVHESTTASQLAELCEVSVRTIYRDMDSLTLAGVPVYMTKGKGGGIHLIEGYTFDKGLLNDTEQASLLESLKMTSSILDNDQALLTKLKSVFKSSSTDWLSIDLSRWGSKEDFTKFELFKTGILSKHLVAFEYCNAYGSQSKKLIKPIKLIYKSKAWYVEGFSVINNEQRLYRLSRMSKPVIKEDQFHEKYQSIGLVSDNRLKYEEIVLAFNRKVSARVYDEFDASTITVEKDTLIVKTSIPIDQWIYGFLLSFMGEVEVISPMSLRENFKEVVINMCDRYSK